MLGALTLLVIFALLGREARSGRISGWDLRVWSVLHGYQERSPGSTLDRTGNVVLWGGGEAGTLLVGLLVLSTLLIIGWSREALFLLVTAAVVSALAPLLKAGFVRTDLKYSFPSGHAARSAAVIAAVVLITWSTRWRWPVLALGAVFTAGLGAALVLEDWHLPSDVVGGWCLAIACVIVLRVASMSATRLRGAEDPVA